MEFSVVSIFVQLVQLSNFCEFDHNLTTGCTKINYALLTGHNKSDSGLILKIYELIFS